jgi:hypothetical protein
MSHQQISRLGVLIVGFAIASLAACTPTPKANTNPTVDVEAVNTVSPEAKATQADPKTAEAKFAAIVGTQQDGWLPKIFAGKGLKQGLSPAAVGKIIPGAEKVSEYGFSKIPVRNIPGLKNYEFYYGNDSTGKPALLQAVKLEFDPANNKAYPDLVKVLTRKYGEASPEDVKKGMIVWVNADLLSAQLTKPLAEFGGYQLNLSLEKE